MRAFNVAYFFDSLILCSKLALNKLRSITWSKNALYHIKQRVVTYMFFLYCIVHFGLYKEWDKI